MNDEALRNFQIIKTENGSGQYVFPSSSSKTGYMFDVQKSFTLARRKTKISDLHFHDLRRTFATRLHCAGIPLYHTMLLLGHSDLKTTQRYLGLQNEEDLSYAVSVLGKKAEKSVETGCKSPNSLIEKDCVSPSNYLS